MRRTQSLRKLDFSLKSFIAINNTRNKQNINSIFMNGSQLKQFYHGMIQIKNQGHLDKFNADKNITAGKKKSYSLFGKENQTIDWRNATKAGMSQKPLITNFETKTELTNKPDCQQYIGKVCNDKQGVIRLQLDFQLPKMSIENITEGEWPRSSQNFDDPVTPTSEKDGVFKKNQSRMKLFQTTLQQGIKTNGKMQSVYEEKHMDQQELIDLRRQQEQKYIQQHCQKLGKKRTKNKQNNQLYQQQNHTQQGQNFKAQDKINRKLNDCFDRYLQHYSTQSHLRQAHAINSKEIQMLHKQRKRQDQISNSIEAYYIKKNKHLKLGNSTKEHRILARNESSKKNMEIILKQARAIHKR